MKRILSFLIAFWVLIFVSGAAVAADVLQDEISSSYAYNHPFKKKPYTPVFIKDDTAPVTTAKKFVYKPVVYTDYAINLSDEDKTFVRPVYTGQVDLRDGVPVKISPMNTVKTGVVRKKLGDILVFCEVPELRSKIPFVIVEPLEIDGKTILAQGVTVMGTVGNVVVQEGGGVPGELVVENFVTYNTLGQKVTLDGKVHVVGKNTAIFAHTMNSIISSGAAEIMPGSAAVLKQGKVYTIFYK